MTIHGIKQLCSATKGLAPNGYAPRYQLQVNLDLDTGKLYWADIVGQGQIQYSDPQLIYVGKISHPMTMTEIREMIDRALEWRGIKVVEADRAEREEIEVAVPVVSVDTSGLYHYEITGDRAEEAAEDLRRRLEFIQRDYHTSTPLEDIAAARRTVAEKYGVEIRAEV